MSCFAFRCEGEVWHGQRKHNTLKKQHFLLAFSLPFPYSQAQGNPGNRTYVRRSLLPWGLLKTSRITLRGQNSQFWPCGEIHRWSSVNHPQSVRTNWRQQFTTK